MNPEEHIVCFRSQDESTTNFFVPPLTKNLTEIQRMLSTLVDQTLRIKATDQALECCLERQEHLLDASQHQSEIVNEASRLADPNPPLDNTLTSHPQHCNQDVMLLHPKRLHPTSVDFVDLPPFVTPTRTILAFIFVNHNERSPPPPPGCKPTRRQ